MNTLIKSISITLIFLFQASIMLGQVDNYEIKVDGLGCPFCAYGLEKKFKEFKGIDDVKIEMETGIFTFTYPAETVLTIEQVENQVEEAGYTAVKTTIIRHDGSTEASQVAQVEEPTGKTTTASIFVAGNCGMCKARIEKAAKSVKGVFGAEWNKDTKMLEVEFDNSNTSEEKIASTVADAGHDTKTSKAKDKVYNKLPGCCHYDRVN